MKSDSSTNEKKASSLKERWEALPTGQRRNVVMMSGIGAVLTFAFLIIQTDLTSSKRTAQGRIENALLVDGNRDLAAAAISNDVKDLQRALRELASENARTKSMLERVQSSAGGSASVDARVQSELSELRKVVADLQARGPGAAPSGRGAAPAPTGPIGAPGQTPIGGPATTRPDLTPGQVPVGVGPIPGDEAPPPPPAYGGIRTIKQDPPPPPPVAETPAKDDLSTFYLPTGSMITGVLLAGVDAPTGRSALKDPIPVLARVKHDAILPNRYRADVKECFALLESSGDLSSERAMMRLTNISCVRRDRSVIDVSIAGYAVGEDGRAGLRGRLVSKQGQVLAKAMFAGFAEGLSQAFGGSNTTSFGGMGTVDYGMVPERGALGGASSALDRIAAYYLDLADQLHPTIEIDAGRRVTIVLLRGRELAALDAPGNGAR